MFLRLRAHRHGSSRSGFTLIELAIVLSVVAVLSAGLWRLMSAGSQQNKDQVTAQQQQTLITAVRGYLADTTTNGGQLWLEGFSTSTAHTLPLPASCPGTAGTQAAVFCTYLPPGFTSATTNPYGQTYKIQVETGSTTGSPQQNYSFMIMTSGGTTIPDTDGGRIAALIGGDGGFIYTAAVCSTGALAPSTACGTMGAWSVNVISGGYGFTTSASGTVASRSFVALASSSSYQWLARVLMPGDTTYVYNTMTTDLYMGTTGSSAPTNIHLGGTTNLINGGSSTSMAQLLMTAPTLGAYSASPIQLSTAGCSQLSSPALTPGCPTTSITYQGNTFTTIMPAINVLSGDISVSNGEITALKVYSASDARLKTNIHPIDDPLGNLMKIDAVAFALREGGSKSMGVTAQNLEKTYPQLVTQSNGVKYVDYNGLIGPLIGAVQELKRENDDLRAQLRRQNQREDRLEHEISK